MSFPNSDGWKRKNETSIQRRECRDTLPARSTIASVPSIST